MCVWKMLFYYQIQQNSASVVISVFESQSNEKVIYVYIFLVITDFRHE